MTSANHAKRLKIKFNKVFAHPLCMVESTHMNENRQSGLNIICMSFDGDYVTEKTGFESIEAAWNHAADLGSRWFFYPYSFVTTASGKTIKDTPETLEHLKGMRTKAVAKHFETVSKQPEAQGLDCEAFSFLL